MIGTFSVSFGQGAAGGSKITPIKKSKGSKSGSSKSSGSNSSKINKSFSKAQHNGNANSLTIFPTESSNENAISMFKSANSSNKVSIFHATGSSIFPNMKSSGISSKMSSMSSTSDRKSVV